MTKYKTGHKDETRRRIVKTASRMFREKGVESTTLPDVMSAAGLTVGGFYKHFESKDALFSEALAEALSGTSKLLALIDPETTGDAWQAAASSLYLTEAHRDNRAAGCAMAALSGDLARADQGVRQTFEEGLLNLIRAFETRMEGDVESRRAETWRFLSLMLGGLILSRAVADAETSSEILAACRGAFTGESAP